MEWDRFEPFPRALPQYETQTISSIIWTVITDSTSYIDNSFAKRTFLKILRYGKYVRQGEF